MSFKSISFTTLLLSTGAFVQAMEQDNIMALYLGDNEAITSFLNQGVKINQPINNNGLTPLHIAASLGYDITVSLLLNHGANPWLKMISGKTPLDLVPKIEPELRKLLLHYQKLWKNATEITFLAGKHHRTSANSLIRELPTDIIKDNIFSHLWPQKFPVAESTAQEMEVDKTPEPVVQEQPATEPSIIEILQAKCIADAHIQQLQHIQVTHSQLLETFNNLSCEQKERLATSIQSLNDEITEIMKAMTNLLELFNHSYDERNSQEQERIQQKLDGHDKMVRNRLLMLEKLIKKQQ